jgi:hypothetical protein
VDPLCNYTWKIASGERNRLAAGETALGFWSPAECFWNIPGVLDEETEIALFQTSLLLGGIERKMRGKEQE